MSHETVGKRARFGRRLARAAVGERGRRWPLLACLWLAACGGLIDNERPAGIRYWLAPLAEAREMPAQLGEVALEVSVVPGLDTDQVLTLGPEARLGQLGRARWADYLPEVLASVLGRSLVAGGTAVVPSSERRGSACVLGLEVQEFFLVSDAGPTGAARVGMRGRLQCPAGGADLSASASVAAAGPDAAAAVAAFQQALDAVTRTLMDQAAGAFAAP